MSNQSQPGTASLQRQAVPAKITVFDCSGSDAQRQSRVRLIGVANSTPLQIPLRNKGEMQWPPAALTTLCTKFSAHYTRNPKNDPKPNQPIKEKGLLYVCCSRCLSDVWNVKQGTHSVLSSSVLASRGSRTGAGQPSAPLMPWQGVWG